MAEARREYNDFGFLKRLLCPFCGSDRLTLDHEDDIGTKFYRCEKCGNVCSKPKTIERMQLEEAIQEFKPEFVFYDPEKKQTITLLNEDGMRVPAAQLFLRHDSELIVGEITYCHALVQRENEQYETVVPVLVWSRFVGGELKERQLKPYSLAKKLDFSGRPVFVELKSKYLGTLDTLMSFQACKDFVAGNVNNIDWLEAFRLVESSLKRFVSFDWDRRLYSVVSCWIIGTYFAEAFSAYPFLYPYGVQGTGKTRLLKTAVLLARHGFIVTDPSEASLYRLAEAFKPCLGVDESLLGPPAWKLIRTAFKRGLKVPRVEKISREGEFLLSLFETYMPCAFSATEMPRDLGGCEADEARAIFIFMQRCPDPIGRDPEPWDFAEVREKLYLLRLAKAPDVLNALAKLECSGLKLYGHEREIWLPLLAIASLAGGDVYEDVLSYASELYMVRQAQQHVEERTILRAILLGFRKKYQVNKEAHVEAFEFRASDLIPLLKEVLQEAGEYEEPLFQRQWTSHKIGKILSRLSVFKKLRGGRSYYIVTVEKLRDLFKQLYSGGFGGLGGVISKPIDSIEKSTSRTAFQITPPNPPNPPCEKCGSPSRFTIVRLDGVHYFCEKCLADWEGKL
ncbi:MAG: TFIIB-type zinc ribbon-containing protein [Candidatus Bathyarchaeia archaeon]